MRTIKLLLLIFIFAGFHFLNAQQYSVKNIAENLKKDAYAVIRTDETTVELIGYDKLKYTNDYAVTVLNESGLGYAYNPIYLSKQMNVGKYTATLYDANGNETGKLKSKDKKDVSAFGDALFDDSRILYYEFTPVSYPFTVHYHQEYTTSNTMMTPGWFPVKGYQLGVESSNYKLINSSDTGIRKNESGFEGWKVNRFENGNTFQYSIENLPPVQEEALSPVLTEIAPMVRLIPNKFKLEGVTGSFENWEQFGKWYYQNLLKDNMELTQKDKQQVLALTEGVDDPVEKVRILYQFMQSKTRYVAVIIGIGGWEPFPASYVGEKSYGDCKALSNYMISLLDFVGIDAFYTIVYGNRSRKQDMNPEFASLQGNHVIVNVPMEEDRIWLECTSQQTAFNYLGGFTDDRYAISVGPNGAEVVTTQQFPAEKNKELLTGTGELFADGRLKMNFEIELSGLNYDYGSSIYFKSEKDQIQDLRRMFGQLPNFELKNYEFTNDRNNAEFSALVDIESDHFASVVGNSLLVNLIPAGKISTSLKKSVNRKSTFEIRFGYTDVIDIELKLPKGYKMSENFKNVIFVNEFGSYLMTVKENEDGSLKIHRTVTVNDGSYDKGKFNDYVEFNRKISSFDNSKILLEIN